MSICCWLYKVRNDVKYLGNFTDDHNPRKISDWDKIEIANGAPVNDHGDIPDFGDSKELLDAYAQWFHDAEKSAFSDGEIHTVLRYNELKRSFKNERAWNRLSKRFLSLPVQEFWSKLGRDRVLVCDEIDYCQGFFFKNKYYDLNITYKICTSKEEMFRYLAKYGSTKRDERWKYIAEEFSAAWEDGCIFVCAW